MKISPALCTFLEENPDVRILVISEDPSGMRINFGIQLYSMVEPEGCEIPYALCADSNPAVFRAAIQMFVDALREQHRGGTPASKPTE